LVKQSTVSNLVKHANEWCSHGCKAQYVGEKMKDNKDKKEEKGNKEHTDMKEFMSALYKLIVAKTENLELESKLNKQFMKDRGIGAKIEADSEQDWPDEFSEEWG